MNRQKRPTPPKAAHRAITFEQLSLGLNACADELSLLYDYLDVVDEFIRKKQLAFEEMYRDVSSDRGFHDSMSTEIDQLWTGLPKVLVTTNFVASFSCLEGSLAILCRRLDAQASLRKTVTWAATKKNGIRRSAGFLKDNLELHLADHPSWSVLCDVAELRNCIVHAMGDADQTHDPRQVYDVVKRHSHLGVSLNQFDEVVLEVSFVKSALTLLQNFWTDLRAALRENHIVGPHYWP